jgi:hypothetical protein
VGRKNRTDKPYVAISEFKADDPDALTRELAEKPSDFSDTVERSTSIFILALELHTDADG